jgi:hypothetical protein
VPLSRPEVDLRSPPRAFDELVDWLERWSYGLVLLEDYPISDIRAALSAVAEAVPAHRASADPWIAPLQYVDDETAREARVLLSDHEWFETSVEQLWGFLRVVEGDDHGGHRQALGQYGRVLAEALCRHRADERRLEARASSLSAGHVP